MIRKIVIRPKQLMNKEMMCDYMNGLFHFEFPVTGIDSLVDSLSEVHTETQFIFLSSSIRLLCKSPYGYKVFLALGKAADENPNLKIVFV